MSVRPLHRLFLSLSAAAMMLGAAAVVQAQKPEINQNRHGVAVKGYDVVAYVTDGKPVKGEPSFSHRWNDATWHFASAASRDAFAREPERYAPQFGGYCAYAVSRGYTADIDPAAWSIVDSKLYLNYSLRVQRMWEQDIPGNIEKARQNWPGALAR